MPQPERGTKRVCPHCGARFYDLNRRPIHCPKCGAEHSLDPQTRAKRGRPSTEDRNARATTDETEAETEEVETEVELDDADDDVLEDTEGFGDEDDVGVVSGDNDDEDDR